MTQVSDPIILAALGALTTAICALWARSERLLTDRDHSRAATAALDHRLTLLLARLSACPILTCPFREWSQDSLDLPDLPDLPDHPAATPPEPAPAPPHCAIPLAPRRQPRRPTSPPLA